MVIEISRDIEQYKESVVFGLTAKQLIYSFVSVGIGGGLVLLLYQYIGLTASAYVAIPVVAPIALGGFYTYNGMNFNEVMKRKIQILFFNRALTYVSTEGEAEVMNYLREEENRLKQNTNKVIRKGAWNTLFSRGRKRG
ncbi:MAG: PrgI family protein [Mobilitalea sp.]